MKTNSIGCVSYPITETETILIDFNRMDDVISLTKPECLDNETFEFIQNDVIKFIQQLKNKRLDSVEE